MKKFAALYLVALVSLGACKSASGPQMPDYSVWDNQYQTVTDYTWRGKPAVIECVWYLKYNEEETERWVVLVVQRPDDASKKFFALYQHQYRPDQGKTGETYLFEPDGDEWKFFKDVSALSKAEYRALLKERYEMEAVPVVEELPESGK